MTRFPAAAGPLRGSLRPPPDKSISHRAALIGAIGDGTAEIDGFLDAADTRSTLAAVDALGAGVLPRSTGPQRLAVSIGGVGLHGGRGRGAEIDVGNAGTLLRILPGWLAGQEGSSWTLDGDESIRRRPVDRVAEPLRAMGAGVEAREGRLPPLRIDGAELSGISYELPVASAQVKSCVLLAGLLAGGATEVTEPQPTRDHTERMLAAAGAEIVVERGRITVQPTDRLEPDPVFVPGDFSSAAFPLVAALLVPGSEVRLEEVGLNRRRIGLLGIAARMGAAIVLEAEHDEAGEPAGALTVRHSILRATRVDAGEVPLAIDELPLVGLLGCFADGVTVIGGATELRHKESDRIAAVVEGLRGLGADIEALADGFAVRGTGVLRGGSLDARGDHRMAMLGAVAGLVSKEGVEVAGMDAARVSYPGFEEDLRSLLA